MSKSKRKSRQSVPRGTGGDAILSLLEDTSVIRVRDVIEAGIHPEVLRRMHSRGRIERVARGMYRKTGAPIGPYQSLIEVQKKMPNAVMCLLTALRYHEVGTQSPREVWIALPHETRMAKMQHPRIRTVRFSGAAYTSGIETRTVGGIELKVYSVAKTIADCFKFRNKIGTNIAVEALRDAYRDKKFIPDELWRYAKICRVTRVMQPYLEVVA